MAPVPLWARLVAIVVGVLTAPFLTVVVLATAGTLAATTAQVHNARSIAVGDTPLLRIDVQYADVVVEPGPDGRIAVDEDLRVSGLTRAWPRAALAAMSAAVSQTGDAVSVRAPRSPFPFGLSNSSHLTVRVPIHANLDLTGIGGLHVSGIDGRLRIERSASVDLTGVTLRGDSTIDVPVGELVARGVTVAGRTVVHRQLGSVQFDGSLAPGGSSLDIEVGTGSVAVTLPRPTDAHASVTIESGTFRWDPDWPFATRSGTLPRQWTADLGPRPSGSVTVHDGAGDVTFAARAAA